MKWSKYNHIFTSPRYGTFLYNSVTNSFVRIHPDLKKEIEQVREWDEAAMSAFPEEFQQVLQKHKLVVGNEADEDYYLKKKYAKYCSAFNTSLLNLTIATTTGCNFACPYCFEKGAQPISMSEEVERQLVDFVKNASVHYLNVTWYGGEPLMNFATIQRLSQAFARLEELKSVRYSIITNGYFLTEEKARFLAGYDIKNIQITIDGLPETHNRLRVAKNGEPTFDRIVSNIDVAAKILEKCRFDIRVNINKQNGEEYARLYRMLSERWKPWKNISIYFSFVEDYGMCGVDCYDSQEKMAFIRELRDVHRINPRTFYPRSTLSLCVANSRNGYVVSANGDLYKCWSDLGKENKVVGSISGNKPANYSLLAQYAVNMDKFEDARCKDCFLFPVCEGGCPQHRYTTWCKEQQHDICPYEAVNIETVLEMIYEDYLMNRP